LAWSGHEFNRRQSRACGPITTPIIHATASVRSETRGPGSCPEVSFAGSIWPRAGRRPGPSVSGCTGLDAADALAQKLPDCRILILTTFGRPGYLRRAMEGGAAGFLLKDAPATELAAAIRRVVAGERIVDPGLAAAALSEGDSPLTPREQRSWPPPVGTPPSPIWPEPSPLPGNRPQPPLIGDASSTPAIGRRPCVSPKRRAGSRRDPSGASPPRGPALRVRLRGLEPPRP
jgi:hypothetical protein